MFIELLHPWCSELLIYTNSATSLNELHNCYFQNVCHCCFVIPLEDFSGIIDFVILLLLQVGRARRDIKAGKSYFERAGELNHIARLVTYDRHNFVCRMERKIWCIYYTKFSSNFHIRFIPSVRFVMLVIVTKTCHV